MSRSSTITDNSTQQNLCFGSYKGSTLEVHQRMQQQHLASSKPTALDRISMRSQESCGNISEYSMPRQMYHHSQQPPLPPPHRHASASSNDSSSNRTFPFSLHSRSQEVVPPQRNFVGSYENYDSPKILSPSSEENYDKPKSIKMYLEQNVAGKLTVFNNSDYGNYDTPNIHPKKNIVVCGCIGGQNRMSSIDDCTCHRVMSWADNWMPCRRGSGIENTGIPMSRLVNVHQQQQHVVSQEPAKCKLSDFSTSETDKSSLYALVDPTKKQTKRLNDEHSKPVQIPRTTSHTPSANYANLDFEKSLEIYENVLKRECECVSTRLMSNQQNAVGITQQQGNSNEVPLIAQESNSSSSNDKENENYVVMEIHDKAKTFPGYISMHPINAQSKVTNGDKKDMTLPSTHKAKHRMLLQLDEKSHSNPDLNRPCLDVKQANAIVVAKTTQLSSDRKLVFKKSSSVDSFRYLESAEIAEEDEQSSTATADTDTYQDTKTIEEASSSHLTSTTSTTISNVSQPTKESKPKPFEHIKVVNVRHGECPSKQQQNRDSSSSNDSGVSTTSAVVPKDYNEFELPLIAQIKKRKQQLMQSKPSCVHASSLIRRSKSYDPFGDLSFQFQHNKKVAANGLQNRPNKRCPSLGTIMTAGYIDSNSTSSGTSDMSDYIETLSLSSHSSSDVEALRLLINE